MNEVWEEREARDKLSKNNAKSLTTLRQRVRKYNRDFDALIAEFKQVCLSNSIYSAVN